MRVRFIIRSVGSLIAFVAFSACADQLPTTPDLAGPHRNTNPSPPRSRYPSEIRFHRISSGTPTFAGYWWDARGNLHVNVTDLAYSEQIRSALTPVFEGYRPSAHDVPAAKRAIIVHAAKFNFSALSAWRDDLFRAIAALQEVQSIGVDERLNLVTVGVVENSVIPTIIGLAGQLGIPRDAVSVFLEEPARELQQLLSDQVDPVAGGLAITNFGESPQAFPCTVGVNSVDAPYFLTNSHCTANYGPEPFDSRTSSYQPRFESGMFIGRERIDPPTFSMGDDPTCPDPASFCRYSDAALFEYDARNPGLAGAGVIYKTVTPGYGPGEIGSVRIDGTFTIIGEIDFPEYGQAYDKVGQATGWTFGYVTETCRNFRPDFGTYSHIWRLCSDQVGAMAGEGDSGAPVFRWLGYDQVALVGLLFAGNSQLFMLSPLGSIWWELGYYSFVRY